MRTFPPRLVPVLAALVAAPVLAVTTPAQAAPTKSAAEECAWMDTGKSADERARLLLKASTLEQTLRWLDEQAANNPAQTTFNGATYPVQVPCTPTVVYSDGPDSVRNPGGVTAFPTPLAQAATWNPRLAQQKGRAQAQEAYGKRRNVLLAPGLASGRTPLSGRTPEYLGEDSLLTGTLAAAGVKGIQQDGKVGATLKHYVANEQELDRQTSSSNIDERTFRQVYQLPFEVALKAGPASVMCSYNQVNGVYACENEILDDLKKETGWKGYVMSDFGSVHSTGPSLNAGLDQELNRPIWYTPDRIKAALADGSTTRKEIDEAAFRVVRSYIRAGLFDNPLPAEAAANVSTPANKAIAREVVEQGSVLLKNDRKALPLKGRKQTIAVIGPTASNEPNANGISAKSTCSMLFRTTPAVTCTPISPLDGITARAQKNGSTVTYSNGDDVAEATRLAKEADVVLVFGWLGMGEFADIPNLSLQQNGDALISAVAAANPNTVAVLETGSAVTMPWLKQVRAVVQAWYPGEQQGNALAALLWGDVNFTGKLPMTFPKSETDLPTRTPEQYPGVVRDGIRQVEYSEGLAVGYKWYDSKNIDPIFEFGHGLSYTTFTYSDLRTSVRGDSVKVTFRVRNSGERAGTETPQVYLTLPAAAGEPGKRLVAFDQVSLKPGAAQTVSVTIHEKSADRPLSVWDSKKDQWRTPSGTYRVQVGDSSRSLPLSDRINLR
ncbi:glycoside hydrolase family 3 C-terminal domain-containing protein [Kineosporia rhizophila]|uniref:beta-glucosidase family protein n=1 Tax=Kineosporia rhizophila TaxID=84633 RepID=UPI001E539AA7|nr:glycoside hydrolase family 3 C-terminal domain-containing protein [Kineosporia rhizophila]MCE0539688.1 glycoside hydrolase family 3 C-terminal domain-containing protein [Kineosporia rhizophila]